MIFFSDSFALPPSQGLIGFSDLETLMSSRPFYSQLTPTSLSGSFYGTKELL